MKRNDVNEHVNRYKQSMFIAAHMGRDFMRYKVWPTTRPLSGLLGADF